jgi:hypothetical protein
VIDLGRVVIWEWSAVLKVKAAQIWMVNKKSIVLINNYAVHQSWTFK